MLIYILAEERSGSTWVTNQLATQLNRTRAYIETSIDQEVNAQRLEIIHDNPSKYSDQTKVYQTHLFPILEELEWFPTHPIVIRTTRKNSLEQLLSYFIAVKKVSNFPNFNVDQPITVTADDIRAYFLTKKKNQELWDECGLHIKQTIYYEDLFAGIRIPALNTTLRFESSRPKVDKAKYFANYDQIEEEAFKQGWI